MSDINTQRLNDFVSACDEEADMLQAAINELKIDISNLEKIVDYDVDDRTPVIRLTCMKLKLAAMNDYASVLSDIDHIAY
jgi:hypothetical protein